MKIDRVFVSVAPTSSYKGYCVMAEVGRKLYPLIYFKRPKSISGGSFLAVVEAIEVKLADGFEFDLAEVDISVKSPVKVAKNGQKR